MSEEIGRHKGAVETLLHEKKELSRLLQIVNGQLKRHLQALEDQGVDAEEFMNQLQEEGQQQQKRQGKREKGQKGQSNQRRSNRGKAPEDDEVDLDDHLEPGR